MVVAQILIDIAGSNLARADSLDHRSRATLAIAAYIDSRQIRRFKLPIGNKAATLCVHTEINKRINIDVLANRNKNYVSFDATFGLFGGNGCRTASLYRTDHLRLRDKGGAVTRFVNLDTSGSFKHSHLNAFGNSGFHLFNQSCHIRLPTTIRNRNF